MGRTYIHHYAVRVKIVHDEPDPMKVPVAELHNALKVLSESNPYRFSFEHQCSDEAETPTAGGVFTCSWCCKDTRTKPCEHCANEYGVVDRTQPHAAEWSRYSINEVECKVCGRRGPYSIQSESRCEGIPAKEE